MRAKCRRGRAPGGDFRSSCHSGCGDSDRRLRELPRNHPLHAGFEPSAILDESDLVLLLGAIAPWHPPSAGPKNGTQVVVLDENPLRPELPYWGYQVDLCLTGAVESSLHLLLERVKKRIGCQDASRAQYLDHWA